MADLTPEEARTLGLPSNAAEVNNLANAAQNDPLAVWWAMITGQDTANSGGAGNLVSQQGGGFNPTRSGNEAASLAGAMALARDVRNAPAMNAMFQAGANAGPRANPYSTAIADQSRPAQLALYQQMQNQMNGPSLATMQAQRGLAQSGQQALGAAAMGAPGRVAMMQAAGAGAGMAGDAGQARLAEMMRAQAGLGGMAGNLRGADLRSADAQMQAALAQRRQDDALRQFYASQGMALQNARNQALANREVTRLQLLARANGRDAQNVSNFANQAASIFGGAATAAGNASNTSTSSGSQNNKG